MERKVEASSSVASAPGWRGDEVKTSESLARCCLAVAAARAADVVVS